MASYADEPDILLPNGRPARNSAVRKWLIVLALLFLGFLLYHNAVPLYTDWLWFGEVGYRNVFSTVIVARTALFFVFGLSFFALFYGNIALARRFAPENADRFLMERFGPNWGKSLQRGIGWILFGVAVFLSLWAGRLGAEQWTNWLEFWKGIAFGVKDPVFGNDVSFYVFRLPLLRYTYEFLLGSLVFTLIAVVAIHIADRAIESWAGLPDIARNVRGQLLSLLAALALMQAFGTRLDTFSLLNNENGFFNGAGYADLHYRLLSLNAQTLVLVLTALACLITIWRGRDFRWPVIGIAAWIAVILILGNAVPAIGQNAFVQPNQFSMEQPYILRNIQFTRQGFGLEKVRSVDSFPADNSLNATGLKANQDTLGNVRLWDYDYLGKLYSQLQSIKPYYKFSRVAVGGETTYNIDIDRYPINSKLRQVMLAAREMDSKNLPPAAQTWQNQRQGYTHGYGVVMSPVNKVVEGNPDYFLSGLPIIASPEAANVRITQPDIYYGQLEHDYVFVDTTQQEFDYPSTESAGAGGSQDHYTTYQGKGGIRIGDAPLAKWAFSLRLGDALMLLQNGFKPETRILFRRDIRERVQTIAPFLQQDADPYLVINPDDGKLVWILDCYTMSDRYPYSTPQEMPVNSVSYIAPNYIRNSIKATVDAYDGSVNFYLADDTDPIARTYAEIFPGLIKPITEMSAGLRAHLRYPEDLFRLQRAVYAVYHVDDARVFYLKEDAWAIPNEPNSGQEAGAAVAKMEPYYVIMRLPGLEDKGSSGKPGIGNVDNVPDVSSIPLTPIRERSEGHAAKPAEEFLLMSPLSPINRESQNILGWMCARCDPAHYGELVLYRFPQNVSVAGPSQIVQLINSDRIISPQLALLRSGGSTATLGNLLVIPVEHSLLYIAPLYVEATNSANKLPQLQKVVVAFGQRVVMEDTLDRALTDLFPGNTETAAQESAPTVGTSSTPSKPGETLPSAVRNLIEKASAQYDAAQQKLKTGDFAGYGTATKELERTLEDLRRAAGSAPNSKSPKP